MNEELLQFLWKHQYFKKSNLKTLENEKIEIINPGKQNVDSGPDFFNASIKIDGQLWYGNVEIHMKSSDWYNHKHDSDKAYNNVILHVVNENNKEVTLPNGQYLPLITIQGNERVIANYQKLMEAEQSPFCEDKLMDLDRIYIDAMLDQLLVERLERKTAQIAKLLNSQLNDWNETFYQFLARYFGFKTNALPFEMLARSLPLKVISHHTENIKQLEALLFGQSGLLNERLLGDDYFISLRDEYSFLAGKYKLKGIESHLWKFMRMRPSNFPTIRIAQFASVLQRLNGNFSSLFDLHDLPEILNYFDASASKYWNTHYHFNKTSRKRVKKLGETSKYNLIINVVIPMIYLYGKRNAKPELMRNAVDILESIPSEENSIIKKWHQLGVKSINAATSQALIQLKNVYCDQKKCLNCQIGNKVLIK